MSSSPQPTFDFDPSSFDMAVVQRAVVAQANAAADHTNEQARANYLGAFANWKGNVDAGRVPNTNPPQPPGKVAVSLDAAGWPQGLVATNEPVCEMPPIPADRTKTQAELDAITGPNHIAIGAHLYGAYWAAKEEDTCAGGFTTPPLQAGPDWPEGAIFQKVTFFMGKGWWLRIN